MTPSWNGTCGAVTEPCMSRQVLRDHVRPAVSGSIGIPVPELRKDVARSIRAIVRVAGPLIAAGTTAIVLNRMGFLGMGPQVARRLGVHTVDLVVVAALGVALALIVDSAAHGGPAPRSPCT